jgi:hypothetical protein
MNRSHFLPGFALLILLALGLYPFACSKNNSPASPATPPAPTDTPTYSQTPVYTKTATGTLSPTRTYTSTSTFTPTNTPTSTFTFTFTPTQTCVASYFGNQASIGGFSYSPNVLYASPVTLKDHAAVTVIYAWPNCVDGIMCGIYSDTIVSGSHVPGILLAQSMAATWSPSDTYYPYDLPITVILSPGQYWLAEVSNSSTINAVLATSDSTGNVYYVPLTFGNAFPTNFQATGAENNQSELNIYAPYTCHN